MMVDQGSLGSAGGPQERWVQETLKSGYSKRADWVSVMLDLPVLSM